MLVQKNNHIRFVSLLVLFFAIFAVSLPRRSSAERSQETTGGRISLAPARVELEMTPGAETTMVVDLDYNGAVENPQPMRIVASLNDWTIQRNGELEFKKANTLPNSASSWLIFSPAETTVMPGHTHSIRVTISVPKDAIPGDHLTALIVRSEERRVGK